MARPSVWLGLVPTSVTELEMSWLLLSSSVSTLKSLRLVRGA